MTSDPTPWTSRCESSGCVETRLVGDQVEIRDTGDPNKVLAVPAKAWAEHEAALRAEVLKVACRALLADAEVYDEKWNRKPRQPNTSDWDKGYVAGMKRAAHDVANSIDRPVPMSDKIDTVSAGRRRSQGGRRSSMSPPSPIP